MDCLSGDTIDSGQVSIRPPVLNDLDDSTGRHGLEHLVDDPADLRVEFPSTGLEVSQEGLFGQQQLQRPVNIRDFIRAKDDLAERGHHPRLPKRMSHRRLDPYQRFHPD